MSLYKLSKRAEAVFNKLTEGLTKVGDHRKWDNAPGTFMCACIEIIDNTKAGKVISIAHYYVQEGDMMRDPDCTLLVSDGTFTTEPGIFPLSYRQDGLGIDRQVATIRADGHIMCYPAQQRDLTKFCNLFMKNLAEQQLGAK